MHCFVPWACFFSCFGRYWVPWLFAWLFSIYALHALRTEYEAVAQLRLDYLADQKRSPQQYTVSTAVIGVASLRLNRTVTMKTTGLCDSRCAGYSDYSHSVRNQSARY